MRDKKISIDLDIEDLLGLTEPKKNSLEYDLNFILENGIDDYIKKQEEHENKKREFIEFFKECFDEICFYMEKDPKRRVSVRQYFTLYFLYFINKNCFLLKNCFIPCYNKNERSKLL